MDKRIRHRIEVKAVYTRTAGEELQSQCSPPHCKLYRQTIELIRKRGIGDVERNPIKRQTSAKSGLALEDAAPARWRSCTPMSGGD